MTNYQDLTFHISLRRLHLSLRAPFKVYFRLNLKIVGKHRSSKLKLFYLSKFNIFSTMKYRIYQVVNYSAWLSCLLLPNLATSTLLMSLVPTLIQSRELLPPVLWNVGLCSLNALLSSLSTISSWQLTSLTKSSFSTVSQQRKPAAHRLRLWLAAWTSS